MAQARLISRQDYDKKEKYFFLIPQLRWMLPALLSIILGSPNNLHALDMAPLGLVKPVAVVVYVDGEVADERFMPPFIARLRKSLVAPVSATTRIYIPPTKGTEARELLNILIKRFEWQREPMTIRVVIVKRGIRLSPSNYSFAASVGGVDTPFHLSMVSLAHLQEFDKNGDDINPEQTAKRVFKLVAKNVARLSGYDSSTKCLFEFPRDVLQLDLMPESFCEPDLATLVAAGIVRKHPQRNVSK
jgi:predicted Zn-dependent protease